mmetsp:Transcript_6826/g.18901  ORF Transcript_6826/g.18901 Transcript_6826/m.18901 type:complete len:208 (-) Transcript_6826:38-661(-)
MHRKSWGCVCAVGPHQPVEATCRPRCKRPDCIQERPCSELAPHAKDGYCKHRAAAAHPGRNISRIWNGPRGCAADASPRKRGRRQCHRAAWHAAGNAAWHAAGNATARPPDAHASEAVDAARGHQPRTRHSSERPTRSPSRQRRHGSPRSTQGRQAGTSRPAPAAAAYDCTTGARGPSAGPSPGAIADPGLKQAICRRNLENARGQE